MHIERLPSTGSSYGFPGVDPYRKIELRMVPDEKTNLTEIRFWYNGKLTGVQKVKTSHLKSLNYSVRF